MAEPQQQTFTDVQPIEAAQTFSNVVPINSPASGLDLKNATTIPNSRIRNLPNPAEGEASDLGALYHGAKTGLTLGMIPAAPEAIAAPGSTLMALGGGAVGGFAGKELAKTAGAGELGQEVSGDVGGLVAGALTAGSAKLLTSKARTFYEALPDALRAKVRNKATGAIPGGSYLRNAIDLWETLGEIKDHLSGKTALPQPDLDATGENTPYAGEKQPKVAWNAHDATGENKPFAGGLDEFSVKLPKVQTTTAPVSPAPAPAPGSAGTMAQSVAAPKPKVILTNDPLLNRLRMIAAKIEMEEKSAPKDDEDLTSQLLESVQQVHASRR